MNFFLDFWFRDIHGAGISQGTQGVQVLRLSHKGIGTEHFAVLSLRLCEHSASDIFLLAYFSVACFLFFFPWDEGRWHSLVMAGRCLHGWGCYALCTF
jgi:hypothetical protein